MQQLEARAQALAEILVARGETVAVSESSSGGLVSAALLSVAGASAYYLGAAVVYTGRARGALLGLPEDLPEATRSASEPYAAWCAETVRVRLGSTWGLAETGAAGPSGNRYGDAPGHTCVAVAGSRTAVRTVETGSAHRIDNMWVFAAAALDLMRETLAAAPGE